MRWLRSQNRQKSIGKIEGFVSLHMFRNISPLDILLWVFEKEAKGLFFFSSNIYAMMRTYRIVSTHLPKLLDAVGCS